MHVQQPMWIKLSDQHLAMTESSLTGCPWTQANTRASTDHRARARNPDTEEAYGRTPKASRTSNATAHVIRDATGHTAGADEIGDAMGHALPSSSLAIVSWQGTRQLTHPTAIWQVQFPKQWTEYESEIQSVIEQQYQNGEEVARFRQCRSRKRDIWHDYRISFRSMEQCNEKSGRVRRVRRIERNVLALDMATAEDKYGVWAEEDENRS